MFISLLSFLLIRTSLAVSITIERTCSTDNDCHHQLICDTNTNLCVCSKPYFWREDLQACFGCAPGWLDFETNKCLLYAISPSPGVTWYQAETICNDLLAQPMLINSTNEFRDLQRKIEDLLNGDTALAATVYFQQGAWIEMPRSEWMDSYTWCHSDQKQDGLDCVQIRQDNLTDAICLQYVSCHESAQFICEAKPVARLLLEKNINESKHWNVSDGNEAIIDRSPRQVQADPLAGNTLGIATKKPSSWNADHITSLATTGMQTVSALANAFGSIFGKHETQPPPAPAATPDPSMYYVNQGQMPQALASDTDGNSNMFLYIGIVAVVLLIIIIIVVVISCLLCSRKKTTRESSIRSTESEASVVSTE